MTASLSFPAKDRRPAKAIAMLGGFLAIIFNIALSIFPPPV